MFDARLGRCRVVILINLTKILSFTFTISIITFNLGITDHSLKVATFTASKAIIHSLAGRCRHNHNLHFLACAVDWFGHLYVDICRGTNMTGFWHLEFTPPYAASISRDHIENHPINASRDCHYPAIERWCYRIHIWRLRWRLNVQRIPDATWVELDRWLLPENMTPSRVAFSRLMRGMRITIRWVLSHMSWHTIPIDTWRTG